ncbi:Flp family type IVb pilin [Methylobacterium sp. 10]|uniref:Flp family type IVb pilin n=1 Tax=Methylobacterium sp. 10 TaxID=1101191 RepID=UPI00048131D8|nr:Flp family type IVb pilin [Methylobacterium sp. 10]
MTNVETTDTTTRDRTVTRPRLSRIVARFRRDTRGTTAIEYALITGLIFLAIVTALHLYADRVGAMYQYIGNAVARSS